MHSNQLENWNWFELNFQWFGLAGAVVVIVLLFGTDVLRQNKTLPKWKDYTWLSWLGVLAYLLHNVEEYGIDILGNQHGFPITFTHILSSVNPEGTIPGGLMFVMVNVPAFWVVAPIAAMLSRRYPITGLMVYGIILVNVPMHIVPFILGKGYNAGMLTAVVVFLPLCAWVFYTCFGAGRLPCQGIALIIGVGVLMHMVLMAAMLAYSFQVISYALAAAIQALNSLMFFALTWNIERKFLKQKLAPIRCLIIPSIFL